jgi:hypothetical protein
MPCGLYLQVGGLLCIAKEQLHALRSYLLYGKREERSIMYPENWTGH